MMLASEPLSCHLCYTMRCSCNTCKVNIFCAECWAELGPRASRFDLKRNRYSTETSIYQRDDGRKYKANTLSRATWNRLVTSVERMNSGKTPYKTRA